MIAQPLPKTQHTPEPPCASLLFGIPYIGLIAISVLYPYFHIVTLPWFTMHIAYFLIIGMAMLWVFVKGSFARVKITLIYILLFTGLYVFMLMHSLAIWIGAQDGLSMIQRGASSLAYQMIGIVAVGAAYVLFGKRAIIYTFWGMVLGNILLMFSAIADLGVGDFVSQLLSFYLSLGSEDTQASLAMEVHDLTFAFATFVIYFAFFNTKAPKRIAYLIVACVFFLLGWKRIAIPGILIAGMYIWFARRRTPQRAIRLTGALGIGLVVTGFLYILIIRAGLYAWLSRTLEIDTMGRVELLHFIEDYYAIDPLFSGYGIGFISRMMQDYILSGQAILNAAQSIHNDILARYIELGFFGFFVWAIYLFYAIARFIGKHWSIDAMIVFFSVLIFCFFTYLTDNTAGYYHINFCLRLFPLAWAERSTQPPHDVIYMGGHSA